MRVAVLDSGAWESAVALVRQGGLPTQDLEPGAQLFWGAWDGDELVAVVALEDYGPSALVRSLAVAPSHRGQGIAGELYRALELGWNRRGTLALLTQTAGEFFSRRGFQIVDREDLPPEVKKSAEFTGLCPLSAQALIKRF